MKNNKKLFVYMMLIAVGTVFILYLLGTGLLNKREKAINVIENNNETTVNGRWKNSTLEETGSKSVDESITEQATEKKVEKSTEKILGTSENSKVNEQPSKDIKTDDTPDAKMDEKGNNSTVSDEYDKD